MITAVKGMVDLLPEESWKWEKVESLIRKHFQNWGYQEIRTPILESIELFKRGVGEATDVVSKEMYSLQDRNENILVLRPEGTAPVVRALIEHQWMAQREMEKVFYLAPFFRYERPQKGRLRQFHQYGIEIIGSDQPLADAEAIAMMWELYRSIFKLDNIVCELNSMGDAASMQCYKTELLIYLEAHSGAYCEECQKRTTINPLRVLDCKNAACHTLNEKAPRCLTYLSEASANHFQHVQTYLQQASVLFHINPFIVRGLDYYQGTTFEFSSPDLGAQSAVGGGGRYDGLFQQLGYKNSMPSVGYAGGIERLMLALEASKFFEKNPQTKKTIFICFLGQPAQNELMPLAIRLRQKGLDVHHLLAPKSLKGQMKQADKLQCKACLIIGDNELQSRTAPLKNLTDGSQKNVSLDHLDWAKELL